MSGRGTLHLVQGGVENGDKDWLEKAARRGLRSSPDWAIPMSAKPGDEVVVYVGGYGFFATATVGSIPRPRRGWHNRYGAALESIRLIRPAISLPTIQRRIPALRWANYPRRALRHRLPELPDRSPRWSRNDAEPDCRILRPPRSRWPTSTNCALLRCCARLHPRPSGSHAASIAPDRSPFGSTCSAERMASARVASLPRLSREPTDPCTWSRTTSRAWPTTARITRKR